MKEIRHDGIIESIDAEGHVRVRITQMAACAGCKIAAHCNASEAKEKIIDVYLADAVRAVTPVYSVGDNVVVSTTPTAAGKALMLGFGLPLVLILAVLAVMLGLGYGEGTAALCALAVLIPYYIIVWLCRNRIASSIEFKIER